MTKPLNDYFTNISQNVYAQVWMEVLLGFSPCLLCITVNDNDAVNEFFYDQVV